ncbi:hypothetical protein HID58_028826, partial [Brassica napus]
IRKDLKGTALMDTKEDKSLPVCWKDKKPLESLYDVKKYFKTITLRFGSDQKKGQLFQVPPESYLITTEEGSVCLGILNGAEIGLDDYNIIGVIYDNEKQRIGWIPSDCDVLPKFYTLLFIPFSCKQCESRPWRRFVEGGGLLSNSKRLWFDKMVFSGTDSSKKKKDGEL